MNVKRITAVLLVREIEPVLPFWVEKAGIYEDDRSPAWEHDRLRGAAER
jgi:hypothetical protein